MIDDDKQIMPVWWFFYWHCLWYEYRTIPKEHWKTIPEEEIKKVIPLYIPKGIRHCDPDFGIGAEVILCYLFGFHRDLQDNRLAWDSRARLHKFTNKFIDLYDEITIEDFYKIYEIVYWETQINHFRREVAMLKYGRDFGVPEEFEDQVFAFRLTPEMYLAYFFGMLKFKLERLTWQEDYDLDMKLLKKIGKTLFPKLSGERCMEIFSLLDSDKQVDDFFNMILDVNGVKMPEGIKDDPWEDPELKNFQEKNK